MSGQDAFVAEGEAAVAIDGAGRWPGSRRSLQLGLMVPIADDSAFGGTPRFADMLEMTRLASDVGFDAAWFADHFLFRPQPDDAFAMPTELEERGVWECFTMMAGLAGATERIQIGALVACTGFRNPGVTAKMAEAIDEISGGRLILGLGAGWHKPEYDMFGLPYDHRVGRFEEAIAIIAPLLRGERVDFAGEFFQAANAVNIPRGPRHGGAPILVGTTGPRMLRLTARHADAWNTVWHKDPEAIPPLMAAVDEACREVGRDPASLVRTAGGNIAMPGYLGKRPDPIEGEPEAMAVTILRFGALGIRHFICGLDPCTPRSIAQFARVIELVDASN